MMPASILERVLDIYASRGEYEKFCTIISKRILGEFDFSKEMSSLIMDKYKKKKTKKRIMICSGFWLTGGMERVLSTLSRGFVNDFEVILVTPYTDEKSCIRVPDKVLHINMSESMFYNNLDYVLLSLCLVLNIDVFVGFHNLIDKILDFYLIAQNFKVKTVASNHEYYFYPFLRKNLHKLAYKRDLVFNSVDAVVNLTNFSAFAYSRSHSNGYLIPNPNTFDPQIQKNASRSNDILCVGRFNDYIKRIDKILSVFRKILNKRPNSKLVLVGKCDKDIKMWDYGEKSIVDMMNQLDIPEDKVLFIGEILDIKEYYKSAKVLLLTSDNEGFPMVVNEAFSFGLPVVSTFYPGIEDLVKDGVNGFVIHDGDIDTIAEKVLLILENNHLQEKLGRNAIEIVKNFDKDVINAKWKSLITSLLECESHLSSKLRLTEDLSYHIKDFNEASSLLSAEWFKVFSLSLEEEQKYIGSCVSDLPENNFRKQWWLNYRTKILDKIDRYFYSVRYKGVINTNKSYIKNLLHKMFYPK